MAKLTRKDTGPKNPLEAYGGLRTSGFVSLAEAEYFIRWAESRTEDEIRAALEGARVEMAALKASLDDRRQHGNQHRQVEEQVEVRPQVEELQEAPEGS